MKLMQEIDVDNITITINGDNKLAMVQPTNSGSTFDVASLPEKQWEAGSKIVALDPQGNTYIFPEDKKFYKDVAVSLRLKSSEYVTDKTRSTVIAKVTNLKDFETTNIDFAFSTGSTVTNSQQTSQTLTLKANQFREFEYVIEHEDSTYVSATVFVIGDLEDQNNSESLTIPAKTPAMNPTVNGTFTNECPMVTAYVVGYESTPLVFGSQYETLENYLIKGTDATNVLKRENLKNVQIKFTNASSVIVWHNNRYILDDEYYDVSVLYKRNQDNTSIESSLLSNRIPRGYEETLSNNEYSFEPSTGILTFTENMPSTQAVIFVRPSNENNCKYQMVSINASLINQEVQTVTDTFTVEGLSEDKYKISLIKEPNFDTDYSTEYNGFTKHSINYIGFGDMTGYRIGNYESNSQYKARNYYKYSSDGNKYPPLKETKNYRVDVTLPKNTSQSFKIKGKLYSVSPQQGDLSVVTTDQGIDVTTTNNVSSTNNLIYPRFTITFEDTTQTIPTPSADGLKIGIICDEQGNRVGYTGVKLEGTIPENITEVVLTKADNTEVRFNYENSKDTYTYQVDTVNYETSQENLVKLTLVTAQGNVVEDLSNSKCSFLNFPS